MLSSCANGEAHNSGAYEVHARWSHCGTCHKMGEEHFGRNVDEFSGQNNNCPKDASNQVAIIVKRMVSKRLAFFKELVT